MAIDQRAITAARNNADLYQAVFDARRLPYRRQPFAFVSDGEPPPYYSHLVVLAPGCAAQVDAELRAAARRFDGSVSFKDSFCEFDLRGEGFALLFEAQWLWRAGEAAPGVSDWSKIDDPLELVEWEEAWKQAGSPTAERIFADAMLQSPNLAFLGRKAAGRFVAGCIANLSSGCVGISNIFADRGEEIAFAEATAAVASLHPHLPIVGYAARPRLEAASRAGYEPTGPLRVLAADKPRV